MNPIRVIVIGAGCRGKIYTDLMSEHPDWYQIVGVAEPIDSRREYIKNKHGVADENVHLTWETILDKPKFADVAIISTMDQMHYEPAMKALELGYDLLLEKPVAPTPEECGAIYRKAKECGCKVMVCHVLRYTPFFMQLKKFLADGVVGNIVAVSHLEAVGHLHQSHSFVRGNWGNDERSTFMLLQKCCHDLDILQWLIGEDCEKIQSFGALTHFCEKNAPTGAPERCIEGCPYADTCYYNAVKLYLDDKENLWFREAATGKVKPSDEDVRHALETNNYGRCVFHAGNNAVDHQTVNMQLDSGATVTLTMCAFTKGGRRAHIMGTDGELFVDMEAPAGQHFQLFSYATGETAYLEETITDHGATIAEGHGGGDSGIVEALYQYLIGELKPEDVSEIGVSCRNHMLAFAAEEARRHNTIVDMKAFLKKHVDGEEA